jgi:Secretion system C-terminal sorting domain
MIYYEKLIIFTFYLLTFSVKILGQINYDIFPLTNGLHYTYTFYQEKEYYEVATLTQFNGDSGKVEYTILDSFQYGDTLKVWNIEERRNLRRWYSSINWDTTYFIKDTTYYQLYESLIGNHELKCSSLVWFFPLNVWPPDLFVTGPDSSIYRYSDSPNILNILSSLGPNRGWEDSTWFSIENGMYKRVTDSYWVIGISRFYYNRYVYQTDSPNEIKNDDVNIIKDFILLQNYPNPFNPSTKIKFTIPFDGTYRTTSVQLIVYDVLGNEIATLVNEEKATGNYEVEFNAANLPSGIYIYKLTSGAFIQSKKMILLK